jgi:hypothetical protein
MDTITVPEIINAGPWTITARMTHRVRYDPDIDRADCSCGWRSHRAHPDRAGLAHLRYMWRHQDGRGIFQLTIIALQGIDQ